MLYLTRRKMLPPFERQESLQIVNEQSCYDIKAGVPQGHVNQRPIVKPILLQKSVDQKHDLGHDQGPNQVFRRLLPIYLILTKDRRKGDRDEAEGQKEKCPHRQNFVKL